MTARERLGRVLAPDVLAALEEYVSERVDEALGERQSSAGARWLTMRESAAYLRLSERTLERAIKRGTLTSSAIGRRRLLSRDDLDRFAATGKEAAPTAPTRRRVA